MKNIFFIFLKPKNFILTLIFFIRDIRKVIFHFIDNNMPSIFQENRQRDSSDLNIGEVFLLYFDEMRGHMPLLSYPDENLIYDKKAMRPINIHSIWFLDFDEQELLDHVDLEFKDKVYFAKKFLVKSEREKKRAGLKVGTPETIVIIVAFPVEIEIFGGPLLKKLTKIIQENYSNVLWEVIEGEVGKFTVIKTKKILDCISKSEEIKQNINSDIHATILKYFEKMVENGKSDSIKKQKAMSFLTLQGINISSLSGFKGAPFDDINLFEQEFSTKAIEGYISPFKISEINISKKSQELEVVIINDSDDEIHDIQVSISHIREFFEKQILNEHIEEWYPNEELLFLAPLFPHIDNYILSIQQKDSKEKLFRKLIEIKNYM